jgi:hypothetical protein
MMPAVLSALEFKPDVVVAVWTHATHNQLQRLEAALRELSPAPKLLPTPMQDEYDLQIADRVEEFLQQHNLEGEILYDITGGTKLMSISFIARKKGTVQYVNTERRMIIRNLDREQPQHVPMREPVPLAAYFAAHGYVMRDEPLPPIRDEAIAYLLENTAEALDAFTPVKTQVPDVNKFRGKEARIDFSRSAAGLRFLKGLAERGLGHVDGTEAVFTRDELKHVEGHWLEAYVAQRLQQLKRDGVFDEVAAPVNLHLLRRPDVLRREIDAVAIRNGELSIFSCKQSVILNDKTFYLNKAFYDNLVAVRTELGKYSRLFFVFVCLKDLNEGRVREESARGVTIINPSELRNFDRIVTGRIERAAVAL